MRKGTGMMFVSKIGNITYYCSSKCYKNGAVMRRKAHRIREKQGSAKQKA
jgi:ribosomal protein L24E